MQCSTYRAAISARLDGEDIGLPAEVLDAHVAGCDDCRGWSAAADVLAGAVARAPRPDVPLDPALLAALVSPPERRPARTRLLSTGEWRVALGVIAVALMVVTWPGAVLHHEGHASVHIAHQLTAWDIGLAAGFLVAALFPARAWGMLPLACVLVTCMSGAFVLDLLGGHGVLDTQFVHALEIAGLICLWAVARRSAHQPGEVRVA
jgi:predicted anti-sigma-YlaC factor YlaD